MRKLKVAIAGLGNRGKDAYAPAVAACGDLMELTAVADTDEAKVKDVAARYQIPEKFCFSSAEEMLSQDKLADVMFICTQDRQHAGHAVAALEKGYHLLLEKPVSPDLEECRQVLAAARKAEKTVIVCHVLRYTPFYRKLKELLEAGVIGEIVSVQAAENVGYYHQAHSFVRGNWSNSDAASPMILQKCCHDMDMLLWLTGKTCRTVSSFGSLYWFKPENAPEGAAKRCLDGCRAKENCPYDAERFYLYDEKMGVANGYTGWPVEVLTLHPTVESVRKALQEGPYGRCVYACGNNVVDHQVVNMNMEDGTTVSFTMCGFTAHNARHTKLMGTLGEIEADLHSHLITVRRFGRPEEVIDVKKTAEDLTGHAGGDVRMMRELAGLLLSGGEPSGSMTTLERSLESHYIALAAEKSRLNGGACVEMAEMRG